MVDENTSSKEIYDEIKALKKAIEDTLYNLRLLLSDLENPFKYLSKFIKSSEESEKTSNDHLNKLKERTDQRNITKDFNSHTKDSKQRKEHNILKENFKQMKQLERKKLREIYSVDGEENLKNIEKIELNIYLKTLVTIEFLVQIFGKKKLKELLFKYFENGLIDSKIYKLSMKHLNSIDLEIPVTREDIKIEDYIIAIYLLKNIPNWDPVIFYILLNTLRRFYNDISILRIFDANR